MTLTYSDGVILGAIVEGVFYGIYMVLFILYLVLRRRNNTVGGALTLAHILLFGLCTLFFCIDISGDFLAVPDAEKKSASTELSVGSNSIFSLIDFSAQIILLYRCWIIWDKRWAVVAIPGFLSLVSLGAGLAFVALLIPVIPGPAGAGGALLTLVVQLGTAAYFISLGVNALTTLLIVTRIFSISREVRPILGPTGSHRSFRIVTAVLIESGLLIFVSQLVYAVLFTLARAQISSFALVQGPITQIYGITPTLLNIRVIMGSTYDGTTGMVSSLKFAPGGAVAQPIDAGSSAATTDTWDINIALDGVPDNKRAAENIV